MAVALLTLASCAIIMETDESEAEARSPGEYTTYGDQRSDNCVTLGPGTYVIHHRDGDIDIDMQETAELRSYPGNKLITSGYTLSTSWERPNGIAYYPVCTLTISDLAPGTYRVLIDGWNEFGEEDSECVLFFEISTPLSVSDKTVVAGHNFTMTPVTSGTVTVSGVSWLHASGNTVYGVAPTAPGEYNVTVSCNGSSASFKITVVSALAFGSVPSAGVFAYEG